LETVSLGCSLQAERSVYVLSHFFRAVAVFCYLVHREFATAEAVSVKLLKFSWELRDEKGQR
jgi:hypothetical protein